MGWPRHFLDQTTAFRKKGIGVWAFDGTSLWKNLLCFRTGCFDTDPDLYHCLTDPDPALFFSSAIFKISTNSQFFTYNLLKEHLHESSKIKSIKKSQTRGNQGVFRSFCLLMEGFGSGAASVQIVTDPDPGGPMGTIFISMVIRNVSLNPDLINFLGPNHCWLVNTSLPVGTT